MRNPALWFEGFMTRPLPSGLRLLQELQQPCLPFTPFSRRQVGLQRTRHGPRWNIMRPGPGSVPELSPIRTILVKIVRVQVLLNT
jgi:hypothetical protein